MIMAQENLKCPKCGEVFEISEAISHDIEMEWKKKYESKIASVKEATALELKNKDSEMEVKLKKERISIEAKVKKEAEDAQRVELTDLKNQLGEKTQQVQKAQEEEVLLRKRERTVIEKEKAVEIAVENELEKGRENIKVEVLKEADLKSKKEIKFMQDQLAETQKDLEDAQKTELEFRNKQRELEKDKQKLELEVARKIDEERNKIREEALQAATEEHKLKDAEKEKQLESAKKKVDELKRKLEQGSQKIQGEVLEIELEDILSQEFPFDVIEPVSPGVKGGDIVHTINTQSGKYCGKILWETKRTKIWSDKWLQKVKDDQRDARADIAVIVSEALPNGFHHFRQIGGVWVTDIPSASSLALALRVVLITAANERRMQAGKEEKKEIVYRYITGPEFKNRVEAIVEAFISMKDDLEKEKASVQRQWAKREKNIERVIANTVGMYGDFEGIAGAALPAIKILELSDAETQKQDSMVLEKEEEILAEG